MTGRSFTGLDAKTGRRLSGDAYLGQLLGKAYSTPAGSRVQRRELTSLIPELVDQPFNAFTRQKVFAAAAAAARQWAPWLVIKGFTLVRDPNSGAFDLITEIERPSLATPTTYVRLVTPLRGSTAQAA